MDHVLSGGPAPRVWTALWSGRARPILMALFVLFALQITWWWVPGRDAGAYLSIARSIADGAPARFGDPHLYYAPGYPLLASPLFLVGERPFLLLSLLNLALVACLAVGVLRWMRRLVGEAAPALTALALINVSLWSLYRGTLSEIAFMTALVWSAILLTDTDTDTDTDTQGAPLARSRTRTRSLLLGALLAALALFTRQAGLALLGGLGLVLLSSVRARERRLPAAGARWALLALPALAVFVAVMLHDRAMAAPRMSVPWNAGYLEHAVNAGQGLGAQLLEGLRLRMAEVGRLLIPGMHKAYAPAHAWLHINTLLYGLVTLVVAMGWWRLARRNRDVLLWSAPFYALLYVIWPFDQGTRFFAPLLPVLVVSLWSVLGSARVVRYRQAAVAVLLVAHLAVAVGGWVRDLERRELHGRWPAIDRAVETIGADRGFVTAPDLPRAEALMLQLALDRAFVPAGKEVEARWVVGKDLVPRRP